MATVPSNLIPTRISQLQIDPSPSLESYIMVNHGGVTYQVQLSALYLNTLVPTTRQVIAGTGLSGGGALSADVTLDIASTGVTAATYGSASVVPVFVVNAQGQITGVTNTAIAIANTAVSGLGTMSTQDANLVAVTGGAIDGTPIGATTRSTGAFTTITLTNALAIAQGGTNSTATATAGGAGYGTGTAHAYTAEGTAGQFLKSNGASAPTWSDVSGGTF